MTVETKAALIVIASVTASFMFVYCSVNYPFIVVPTILVVMLGGMMYKWYKHLVAILKAEENNRC